jgi:hypothetical protein
LILQKKCLYFVNDGAKGLRDFIRAVPGTVIGGVSGALDEDESFTDGEFKGGLIWMYVCWHLSPYWRICWQRSKINRFS